LEAFHIRPATVDDAEAACRVVRRSIAELCVLDHSNDPALLEPWLANKTSSNLRQWIADNASHTVVACQGADSVGVAALHKSGVVTLNYILPEVRFMGVSTALLASLEHEAAAIGIDQLQLTSTKTARRFYLRCGFLEANPVAADTGSKISMTKRIVRATAKDETYAPSPRYRPPR
jgi:N-acetylglutamate synthase-like GNAT family acetyltransferase